MGNDNFKWGDSCINLGDRIDNLAVIINCTNKLLTEVNSNLPGSSVMYADTKNLDNQLSPKYEPFISITQSLLSKLNAPDMTKIRIQHVHESALQLHDQNIDGAHEFENTIYNNYPNYLPKELALAGHSLKNTGRADALYKDPMYGAQVVDISKAKNWSTEYTAGKITDLRNDGYSKEILTEIVGPDTAIPDTEHERKKLLNQFCNNANANYPLKDFELDTIKNDRRLFNGFKYAKNDHIDPVFGVERFMEEFPFGTGIMQRGKPLLDLGSQKQTQSVINSLETGSENSMLNYAQNSQAKGYDNVQGHKEYDHVNQPTENEIYPEHSSDASHNNNKTISSKIENPFHPLPNVFGIHPTLEIPESYKWLIEQEEPSGRTDTNLEQEISKTLMIGNNSTQAYAEAPPQRIEIYIHADGLPEYLSVDPVKSEVENTYITMKRGYMMPHA